MVPFSEEEIENILKACDAYSGPNRERSVVLTKLMLTTGLAIGDASMLSKDRVIKNGSGWYVELRRAKTGTAVRATCQSHLHARSKVFISPMDGFESYLLAAFGKKNVQLIPVADQNLADYVISGTSFDKKRNGQKLSLWETYGKFSRKYPGLAALHP